MFFPAKNSGLRSTAILFSLFTSYDGCYKPQEPQSKCNSL
jgi:hypothetical protein